MKPCILAGLPALFAVALLTVMLSLAPAAADEAFEACFKASPAEARCGEEWIAREQQLLDTAWKHLTEVADGEVAQALNAEQRAWEAFRELSCTFKLDEGFGGAGGPTGYHACRAELIAARTAALQGYVKYIDN